MMPTDMREDWDYWEKKRHDNAHSPGCLGPFLGMLLFFVAVFPLSMVVLDFYVHLTCNSLPNWCPKNGPPLNLQWNGAQREH